MSEYTWNMVEQTPNEKKSPPRKEKSTAKTPQSVKNESKFLKRKLSFSPGGASEDEADKRASTPKRRRSLLAGEGSPNPGATTPKTPGGTSRLTERQQMALLMQMTAEEGLSQSGGAVSGGETSPRPSSPHGSAMKRTQLEKKVHKRNERGETPLHVAAIKGDQKQIKRLIKAGADVNVADFAGWTAIHEACNHGWLVVAKQLLKAGANVNVQGMDNDTPLHDAAVNGHKKLVELLLRHGANPLQPNTSGNTPMDVAVNEEIRKLLRNEIIASSSSSSGIDEVRSPTSPESNASDKPDSPGLLANKLDSDSLQTIGRFSGLAGTAPPPTTTAHTSISPLSIGMNTNISTSSSLSPRSSLLHSTSLHSTTTSQSQTTISPNTSSSIFKKVHVFRQMDTKSSSPRLTIKFQHIKSREPKRVVSPKRSHDASDFKSYSVTLSGQTSEYDKPISPTGSSNSQDSDLYDPQLEITTYGSKRTAHQGSSSTLSSVKPISAMTLNSDDGQSKAKSQMDYSEVHSPVSDSELVMLSQGTGPFTPQFEDISDAEDNMNTSEPSVSTSSLLSLKSFSIPSSSSSVLPSLLPKLGSNVRGHVSSTSDVNSKLLDVPNQASQDSPSSIINQPSGASQQTTTSSLSNTVKQSGQVPPETKRDPSSQPLLSWPKTLNENKTLQPAKVSLTSQNISSQPRPSHTNSVLPRIGSLPLLSKPSLNTTNASKLSPSSTDSDKSPKSDREKHEKLSPKSDNGKDCAVKSDKIRTYNRLDRENTRSPKPERPECRWSPKPHKENSAKNTKENSRASPKPDRDSRDSRDSPKSEKDGKSSASPKVPPLKIIMPQKTTSEKAPQSFQKALPSRASLPYVLNPTHDGEQGGTSVLMQTAGKLEPSPTSSHSQPGLTLLQADTSSQNSTDAGVSAEMNLRKTRNRSTDKERTSGDSNDGLLKSNSSEGDKEPELSRFLEIGDDKESSRDSNISGEKKEDGQIEKRVTRSAMRSQQQHKGKDQGKDEPSTSREGGEDGSVISTRSASLSSTRPDQDDSHIHPRKRKLRNRQQDSEQNTPPPIPPPQHMEKPTNPYELYLDIRKTISSRHKRWFVVQPKAPQGFHDYLMVSCKYLIKGNSEASRLAIPLLTPPSSLEGPMLELFKEQEKARYKLRLQHNIEQEKLILSIEQEILRVHGRAARALANQSIPLSVCAILRDQDIYNSIDPATEDRDKNIRSRYNGRQFFSWLRDVDDKYEKIKEALLLRHHHEVESLNAVQKLEWEWKLREISGDPNNHAAIDAVHVPMVPVNDDFDLLPS